MSILEVTNLTQSFGDKVILKNISFNLIKRDHIGLIGANGEGKTTLFRLLTKEILPDSGNINWSKNITIGYMNQDVKIPRESTVREYLREAFNRLFKLEKKLQILYEDISSLKGKKLEVALKKISILQDSLENSDFYSIESKIEGISNGLGFKNLLDLDVLSLSGGERSKVLLAKLLLAEYDILLLDEPTNHLDEENISWLKSYLINYNNAFIVVSHDNNFVNSIVNVIYHLENKTLIRYVGNYDKFLNIYKERKSKIQIEYLKQKKRIEKLENYIKKNNVRASTATMSNSRKKQLNKIEKIEINRNRLRPHFDFIEAKNCGDLIFETENLVVGYDKHLSNPLNLKMIKGEKIALVGSNGIGKTTLLKSLLGLVPPIDGKVDLGSFQKIAYFEQNIDQSINNKSVIEYMWNEFPESSKSEIITKLARCGLTINNMESKMSTISGGERAKVKLCKLINTESNILILDEPTNHLDQESKNELKRALKSYKGSILLVSHEFEFYNDIVLKIWNLEDAKITKI